MFFLINPYKILFTLFETKVSFFQSQIFLFTSSFKFAAVNFFQRISVVSLFSRLSVVNKQFLDHIYDFSSETRRLQMVFNLRKRILLTGFSSVYFNKRNGGSKFFMVPNIYFLFYSRLFCISFNPYAEKFFNRFSFFFRPFRSSLEAFNFIKVNIMLRVKYSVIYNFPYQKV